MSTNYNHNARILYKTVNPGNSNNTGMLTNPAVNPTGKQNQLSTTNESSITLNNISWAHTAGCDIRSGDPTTTDVNGNPLKLSIMTTENNSANVFWGSFDKNHVTERGVRGLSFRTWNDGTNGEPRLAGVCLVYVNGSGSKIYCPIAYQATYYTQSRHGSVDVSTGDKNNKFWGVIKAGDSSQGDAFHMKAYKWAGVLFHYKTYKKKMASARDQPIYISHLRPICDDARNSSPSYKNQYRVWGSEFK